ncbi:MAG: DUF952 domain-containing protein [Paracoccaceae bacterium]|nr:DUF952 domain-containing protein [Paracoccaceae bacterium]
MTIIYKIFRPDEYADFISAGRTRGAPVDLADGYIHFSTGEQVEETAAKHFNGEGDLKLLGLDADTLGSDLIWEPSRGGALFPHLYRELVAGDVLFARDLRLKNGKHDFKGLLS